MQNFYLTISFQRYSGAITTYPSRKAITFRKTYFGPTELSKTKKDLELKQTLKVYMDNQCDITKRQIKYLYTEIL